MSKIPTTKFLEKFPDYTSLTISIKENGKSETPDVLLKIGESWASTYHGGKSIKNTNIPKFLEYMIDGVEEYLIKVNPNRHSDGDEPIHVFTDGIYYTTNNAKFLKGYRTHTPSKNSCPFKVNFRKMI